MSKSTFCCLDQAKVPPTKEHTRKIKRPLGSDSWFRFLRKQLTGFDETNHSAFLQNHDTPDHLPIPCIIM